MAASKVDICSKSNMSESLQVRGTLLSALPWLGVAGSLIAVVLAGSFVRALFVSDPVADSATCRQRED